MDISSIYEKAGYTNDLSKSSNTQKSTNTEKAAQAAELPDAKKLEDFKKEVWKELDSMPWNSNADISIQVTDKAFERMMKEPEFKDKMMKIMREESMAATSGTSLTWIDENGYRGYSYMEGYGKEAFAAHAKDKDSFYTKKATKKQDYKELYEKERQQKKLQQEKLDDAYWDSVDLKRTLLKKEQASKAYESNLSNG